MALPQAFDGVLRGLWLTLLASGFTLTAGDLAEAQDCTVKEIPAGSSVSAVRDYSEENFRCLLSQVEALKAENAKLQSRLESVTQGGGLVKYVNRDGTADRSEPAMGSVTYVLSGDRQGNATSLGLDHNLVLGLCADSDGCHLELGLDGIMIGGEEVETRFSKGPCSFHFDRESGAWALSGLCASAELPSAAGTAPKGGFAPDWGRSGDAGPMRGTEQDGRIILALGGACFLAETAPNRRVPGSKPRFERDTDRGLYLVTAGTKWDPTGSFPADLLPMGLTDPEFRCRLTLRD